MQVSKRQSINANYSTHPQNTYIFNSLVVKKHSNNQNKNLPCCQRTMDFMRLVGLDILGRCWQWEIRFQAQFPFLEQWSKGELSSRTRKLWNLELWLEVTARTSSFNPWINHKLTKATNTREHPQRNETQTKSNTILEQTYCIDLAPTTPNRESPCNMSCGTILPNGNAAPRPLTRHDLATQRFSMER